MEPASKDTFLYRSVTISEKVFSGIFRYYDSTDTKNAAITLTWSGKLEILPHEKMTEILQLKVRIDSSVLMKSRDTKLVKDLNIESCLQGKLKTETIDLVKRPCSAMDGFSSGQEQFWLAAVTGTSKLYLTGGNSKLPSHLNIKYPLQKNQK